MAEQYSLRTFGKKSARGAVVLSLAAALAVGPVREARATCATSIITDAVSTTVSNVLDVAKLGIATTLSFNQLFDALVRLANQGSNDMQNVTDSLSIIGDKEDAGVTANAVSQQRVDTSVQFTPSRVVCRTVSAQNRVAATMVAFQTSRAGTQTLFNNFSTNALGTDSERGTLYALNRRFNDRCTKYANTATMLPPPGITCPGGDANFRDLDIQPWKAVIDPITFTSTAYRDAAIDSVRMLTEIAPPDPLKGPALSRTDGQNLHMLRMRDTTRMNLARGVLEDMVAMRTESTGDDGRKVSRLGRYIELITGQRVDGNTLSGELPVIMAAGEPENAAVQTIGARLAVQQALIFELMRLTEQIVSVEAVELAVKVERSRAGNTSVATRVLQAN